MIVSFDKNFIFIKTRKTAGTTIEIALTSSCGPKDIITPINFHDELTRLQEGRVAARNYSDDPELERKIARSILKKQERRWRKLTRRAFRNGALQNHAAARIIRDRVPKDFWDGAFKFTVERHPYEKVVSAAYWEGRNDPNAVIADLLDKKARTRPADERLYTIDGQLVVDEIIRQESLNKDLDRIAEKLGLKLPGALPRAKSSFRLDRRPAREILSDEQKAIIYERQRATFERLGYEP